MDQNMLEMYQSLVDHVKEAAVQLGIRPRRTYRPLEDVTITGDGLLVLGLGAEAIDFQYQRA